MTAILAPDLSDLPDLADDMPHDPASLAAIHRTPTLAEAAAELDERSGIDANLRRAAICLHLAHDIAVEIEVEDDESCAGVLVRAVAINCMLDLFMPLLP